MICIKGGEEDHPETRGGQWSIYILLLLINRWKRTGEKKHIWGSCLHHN